MGCGEEKAQAAARRTRRACFSACARAALRETLRQEAVVRMRTGFLDWFRISRAPGVRVRLDAEGRLHIAISVVVRYGTDLRELAKAIQEAVVIAVRGLCEYPLGRVDIVADMARREED